MCAFKFEDPKRSPILSRVVCLLKAIQAQMKMFTNLISQNSNFKWSWTKGLKQCIQICIDDVTRSQNTDTGTVYEFIQKFNCRRDLLWLPKKRTASRARSTACGAKGNRYWLTNVHTGASNADILVPRSYSAHSNAEHSFALQRPVMSTIAWWWESYSPNTNLIK